MYNPALEEADLFKVRCPYCNSVKEAAYNYDGKYWYPESIKDVICECGEEMEREC